MAERNINANLNAYVTEHHELKEVLDPTTKPQRVVANLYLSAMEPLLAPESWTHVGIAIVTVVLHDDQELRTGGVGALHAQIKSVQADAETRVTQLRARINELLAIDYTPPPADQPPEDVPF